MEFLIAVVLLALVAAFVSVPLRRPEEADDPEAAAKAELADLEQRRDVRYREIRDLEADHAAGKIGDADFAELNTEMRREAIEILKQIDRLAGGRPKP